MQNRVIRNTLLLGTLLFFACPSKTETTPPQSKTVEPKNVKTILPPQNPFPDTMQKGICYAHAWRKPNEGGYGTPKDKETLKRLQELGVTWISLTPFGFQSKRNSPKLRGTTANWDGAESDSRIIATTKAAHELGIKVLLKPHIWIGDSSWCGAITPPDWDVWFDSYQKFVEQYAILAETMKADGFVIGNELKSATKANPERFRQLIKIARKHYSGPITYAANWDEAERIPFWDALDAIGISAYWPLAKQENPSEEELYQGALRVEAKLASLAKKNQRSIILTEIGFRSVANAGMRPNTWPENDKNPKISFETQERAYRAVFRAFWQKPYFHGLYFWKVISDGSWEEDGGSAGFSPLGKPAEKVLEEYFAKEKS